MYGTSGMEAMTKSALENCRRQSLKSDTDDTASSRTGSISQPKSVTHDPLYFLDALQFPESRVLMS